jgi:hypothetical protein
MVNNFTNINKANIQLAPLTIENDNSIWCWKPGHGLGQVHKCGGVKPVNEMQTLSLFTCCNVMKT